MSEPKYETLTLGRALDAVANGEQVAYRYKAWPDTARWYLATSSHKFCVADNVEFRRLIKPKKKLVPFTFETFPRGAWIRRGGQDDLLVMSITESFAGSYSYQWLLENCKLLVIENGSVVGEKPCGLEVEE